MKVSVLTATKNPIDVISLAAGTSTGKQDTRFSRARSCIRLDHSVSEFADITFRIEGISRACLAQLTRHRMASFCVESQRYNKYSLDGDDWYVIPPEIAAMGTSGVRGYEQHMRDCAIRYKSYLAGGIKPEDARFMLPEATKTNLTMKINLRSLIHFLKLRTDKHSQWEIQDLAWAMFDAMKGYSEQWSQIADIVYDMLNE